ncbi:hypothetical protein [Hydrogenimonas thermophila]|uniref:Uncharacterized protein n=1 Tax=Hydrogenimonas thermophila TaxID=223786 RepID=A0A1I5KQG2_9BACT|nr:hypothetical protein [Hydrogenimonas thermophila]SFO87360.1 hypothetical protein SAMN05216234_10142 [Hydrogenimonas thermophila]
MVKSVGKESAEKFINAIEKFLEVIQKESHGNSKLSINCATEVASPIGVGTFSQRVQAQESNKNVVV